MDRAETYAGGEPDWPLRLRSGELAALLELLAIPVASTSPIAPLLAGCGESPPDPAPPEPGPEVARALRLIAAPRQSLRVSRDAGQGDSAPLAFLGDGETLAGFDLGEAGCTVAAPCGPARFAQMVCSLAGIEATTSTREVVASSERFLEAIVALRLAGLFDSPDARVRKAEAEAALSAVRGESEPGELLGALELDGVLSVEREDVCPRPDWLERHPSLTVPAALRIDAAELGDLAAGRDRAKRLAILGEPPEHVVLLPPPWQGGGHDLLLELEPATALSVEGAVRRLIAPPLSPPVEPVAELDGSTARWLTAGPAESAPDWSRHALEELAVPGELLAPPALLAPQATADILSWGGGGDPQRTVFAFDSAAAVEWTLDGSLVRWRELGRGGAAARIDELIGGAGGAGPVSHTGKGEAAVDLDALRAAVRGSGFGALPERLRALAADPETRWCAIRARRTAAGEPLERVVLVASGPAGGSWRLESEGGTLDVRPVRPDEVHAELVGALAPDAGRGD